MVRVAAATFAFTAFSLYGCGTDNANTGDLDLTTDSPTTSTLDGVELPMSNSSTTVPPTGTTATTVPSTARCEFHAVGNPEWNGDTFKLSGSYQTYLDNLDIHKLYDSIVTVMTTSKDCWPADGPQDGDTASYAGLFGRLAWHCAGTLRVINNQTVGGCEGGRIRFWPEREWRDNGNLEFALALLGEVKNMPDFQQLSWGDLITFAGTVGIKASSGPVEKFCFGREDAENGQKSVMLGTEGIEACPTDLTDCQSHSPCEVSFHWPGQDPTDPKRCNATQSDGRQQGSHSVGLIYVYPNGPQLRQDHPDYVSTQKHQRSPKLSAMEVRDTFTTRMGWTDQETVALIGGGHTLGRAHGNCASNPSPQEPALCRGPYTKTSGFEGAWTRTPSTWNYDFFEALLDETWMASKSPDGEDQWETQNQESKFSNTMRLTSDLALIKDEQYKEWVEKYNNDHGLFNTHFAQAWFKLMHRSESHPEEDALELDANKCTTFDFL